jgi:dipeptidase
MISLHKWYPIVQPRYDIQTVARDKYLEKIEFEHDEQLKAQKIRKVIDEYDLDLYNKRARINTIELEIFSNRKKLNIFV